MLIRQRNDARLQPGAYIASRKRLYEVVHREASQLTLEDCGTFLLKRVAAWRALGFTLVRPAPTPPDHPPEDSR